MLGEEILLEIDATLDQLIRNAEVMQHANNLSETEVDAFQKTQESLLHHLMHMDQTLDAKRKNLRIPDKRSANSKIQEKLQKFQSLQSKCTRVLPQRTTPIFSKRKNKKILTIQAFS